MITLTLDHFEGEIRMAGNSRVRLTEDERVRCKLFLDGIIESIRRRYLDEHDTPPVDASFKDVEKWHLKRALEHRNGHTMEDLADSLGICSRYLYIKRKQHGLKQ